MTATIRRRSESKTDPLKSVSLKLRQRAERLLEIPIEYIPSPEFSRIRSLDPVDLQEASPTRRRSPSASLAKTSDLPPFLASLYEVALLSADEERALFRRMNYYKYRADRRRKKLKKETFTATDLRAIEQDLAEAEQAREHIIRANLRLVVSNARSYSSPDHLFEDLVSDGSLSLMQAADKFDYSRGFRFSTYATHAIRRAFFRRMERKNREKQRMNWADSEILSDIADPVYDVDETENTSNTPQICEQLLSRMSETLTEREQVIVRARFSLDGEEEAPTLQTLAQKLGLCKERVRQLQNRALEKLRTLAEEIRSALLPDSSRMEPSLEC